MLRFSKLALNELKGYGRNFANKPLLPLPKYGGENSVTLLTGSTVIGKQGASYIRNLCETAKVPVNFERIYVGPNHNSIPKEFVTSVLRNRAAIHIDIQLDPRAKHQSLMLNNDLDLYACVIKMHSLQGYKSLYPDIDIVLAIQNNTGDFTKLEYQPVKGVIETLKISQRSVIERYVKFVYKYALANCREKITFGHKIEEMPKSDGMIMDAARKIHKQMNLDIKIEFMKINELVRTLITCPQQFDMICASETYGTFVASTCAAVCGGASLFSATELGDHHAVFKPLQTKLSLTGSRTLSPYGIVRACIDLLNHLGHKDCAKYMWKELMNTMFVRCVKTAEYGGTDSGDFVICDIVNNLKPKFV